MAYGGDLQANTAVDLMVGPFLDETNGKDAETGLTITQAEVRLSKNGANMAQKNEATSLTHDELGNYVCKLNTTDTNTEGILTLMIHESGALPIKMDYTVLAQAAYISKYTAKDTGFMDVDIKAISTDTTAADNLELFTEVLESGTGLIDAGTFKAAAIDSTAIADNAITAAKINADAITNAKIADDAIGAENLATDAISADALSSAAVDEIWAKAMSDLAQGAPSATASALVALNHLYEAWRNKTTTTATLITLMKDDGSTGLVKSTISDDGTTFIKGEFITGA